MAELTNIFQRGWPARRRDFRSGGEEALAFLRSKEGYHSHRDMIFLDLDLPKFSGC
jgi:hypothetical protein